MSVESGPKTPSRKEIIDAIKAEGFEVKEGADDISFSEIEYAGFEVSSPKFTKIIQDRITGFSKTARKYLSGVVVTDTFGGEHSQRRQWRDRMGEIYGKEFADLYITNKLRINRIAWVRGDLSLLASALDIYKVHSPAADEVRKLLKGFPDIHHYDQMITEEKLKAVDAIESICRSFLKLISK
jgi:hypothetical protein